MGNYSDYKRETTPRLEPGDYRVELVEAEDTFSKAGKPMIVITVKPNGSTIKIKHYIVKNEYFNRNMTSFFDSFNINDGDFSFLTWPGAVGAAKLVTDDNGYLKVRWWIRKDQADKLCKPWVGPMPERQTVNDFMRPMSPEEADADDDLPFK